MTAPLTAEFLELFRFMRLLDRFPEMEQDTRARLFIATVGADNENERQVFWAALHLREMIPGFTLKAIIGRAHKMLPHRSIPTSEQILSALTAHADQKENAS